MIAEGYITAKANQLKGAAITFDAITVTELKHYDGGHAGRRRDHFGKCRARTRSGALADCLTQMGAKIDGAGTSRITITGVSELNGVDYTLIRIALRPALI